MPEQVPSHEHSPQTHVQVFSPAQGVIEIRLSRPEKRNALSLETLRQIEQALDLPQSTRVVVLSAEGPVFSAGVDIGELYGDKRDLEIDGEVHRVAGVLSNLQVPTIAAVDRDCIGAANEFLLACDGWVMARGSRLRLPAIGMGLLYEPTSISKLQQRIGVAAANRLVLLQQPLHAEDVGGGAILVEEGEEHARIRALEIAADLAEAPEDLVVSYKRMLKSLASGAQATQWIEKHTESFGSADRSAAIIRAQQRRSRA